MAHTKSIDTEEITEVVEFSGSEFSSPRSSRLDEEPCNPKKTKLFSKKRKKRKEISIIPKSIFCETDLTKLTQRQQILVLNYHANRENINPLFAKVNDFGIDFNNQISENDNRNRSQSSRKEDFEDQISSKDLKIESKNSEEENLYLNFIDEISSKDLQFENQISSGIELICSAIFEKESQKIPKIDFLSESDKFIIENGFFFSDIDLLTNENSEGSSAKNVVSKTIKIKTHTKHSCPHCYCDALTLCDFIHYIQDYKSIVFSKNFEIQHSDFSTLVLRRECVCAKMANFYASILTLIQ